jgi:amino acid transporter
MVINESLVARTFGNYTLQLFDAERADLLVPVLGVGLLVFAFLVNIAGNRLIDRFSLLMAVLKIGGVAVFACAGLWLAGTGRGTDSLNSSTGGATPTGFLAGVALAILAYKGFTTITNSGSELVDPHRNVGRAIVYSIGICVILYFLVALAVDGNLSLTEIIRAKDFALAEAARPLLGHYGLWFTVILAIVATVSGVIASVFAVSRMLAMLTDMQLVPHRHFGMPGSTQQHTLVYTVVLAILLTVFFDLSRIASLGAIFYIVMDIAVHWGVYRHLRQEIQASPAILLMAILLDAIVLGAFITLKLQNDAFVVALALSGMAVILCAVWLYLRTHPPARDEG